MYRNIQALRALAAYGVVIHHVVFTLNDYIAPGRYHLAFKSGEFGLDLFFVISGFIMAATTQDKPITASGFMLRRIARVAPLYWLFVLFAATLIAAGFNLFGGPSIRPVHILRDLLFLPTFYPNGVPENQIVYVGWTLNYEMFFYAIVALSLLPLIRRHSLAFVWGVLLTLIILRAAFHPNAYINYWGLPRVLEFAAGMVIWKLTRRYAASRELAWVGIVAAALGVAAIEWARPWLRDPGFVIMAWAPCAVLIVYCAVSLETHKAIASAPLLQFQGDASYSLYLSHTFTLQFAAKLVVLSGMGATLLGVAIAAPLLVFIAGAAGAIIYVLVEKPTTQVLHKCLRRRPTPASAAAQPL